MFEVSRSQELSWEVVISGSKNAALPILAATLLVKWKLKLNNVPRIWDVLTFLDIIATLWGKYSFEWKTLNLDTSNLDISNLDADMIKKIRASILLLSPL